MKSQLEVFKEYITQKLTSSTYTISVVSGKGGVGKTNLVVNLGIFLQRMGFKVLLVDFDLGLSNLDILLNVLSERKFNLSHYFDGKVELENIIVRTRYGLDIITGALGDERIVNMNSADRERLLNNLDKLIYSYEFVLLDMGAGISENIVKLSLCADNIILVTTSEPHSLLSAYGVIKVVQNKLQEQSVYVVINSAKNKMEAQKVQNGFIDTVYKFLNIPIESLGYILYDPAVSISVKDKIPFIINHPKSIASENIETISVKLCTKLGVNIKHQKKSLFSRLFRNFL